MRAVLKSWHDPPIEDLADFAQRKELRWTVVTPSGRGWDDFECVDSAGETILEGDLTLRGSDGRLQEELDDLNDDLERHRGSPEALAVVRAHIATAKAIAGMRILMSRYDDSVDSANGIIRYLEQEPGALVQVDTVGWYQGDELLLRQ